MRRFFALMLVLPALLMAMSACNDDDDAPVVNLHVAYNNAVGADGVLYVVQGQMLEFTAVTVTTTNPNKYAAITGAEYYWDGIPAGGTITEPFSAAFNTALYSVGEHFVKIRVGIVERGYSPTFSVLTIPVVILSDDSQLPDGGTSGEMNPSVNRE